MTTAPVSVIIVPEDKRRPKDLEHLQGGFAKQPKQGTPQYLFSDEKREQEQGKIPGENGGECVKSKNWQTPSKKSNRK